MRSLFPFITSTPSFIVHLPFVSFATSHCFVSLILSLSNFMLWIFPALLTPLSLITLPSWLLMSYQVLSCTPTCYFPRLLTLCCTALKLGVLDQLWIDICLFYSIVYSINLVPIFSNFKSFLSTSAFKTWWQLNS